MPSTIHHALVLNFHQPPGNLERLWHEEPWEAKEILYAMDRMPRALWDYSELARVHLSLSGTLLEVLKDPAFQAAAYGTVKVGELLYFLQNREIFQVLGTGYYHPVFPLIPRTDWDEHARRWRGLASHLLWRQDFHGFWPPEMGFCSEMIPWLKRMGYRYVLVDDLHLEPKGKLRWEELRYRPHVARHGDDEIIVIPRDRELSNAQESGMDPGWFIHEVEERTKWCDWEPLVVTATDGENGGWFRNHNPEANFWYAFYRPLLDRVRAKETRLRPCFLDTYLEKYPPLTEVIVHPGAWNTGDHSGQGFVQWTGSQMQKDGLARIAEVSQYLRTLQYEAKRRPVLHEGKLLRLFEEAQWRILRAETSCHFYWGEAWVQRAHDDLDAAIAVLSEVEKVM